MVAVHGRRLSRVRSAMKRREWRCLFELDPETSELCPVWGYADRGENPGRLLHQHYLDEHYEPPSEDKP